jgi:hypothetical protein
MEIDIQTKMQEVVEILVTTITNNINAFFPVFLSLLYGKINLMPWSMVNYQEERLQKYPNLLV